MIRSLFAATVAMFVLCACGPELEGQTEDSSQQVQALKSGTTSSSKKVSTARPPKKSVDLSTYATRTTDAYQAGVEPTWKSSFGIIDTYTVEIANEVPSTATGSHTLNVYLYSPSGSMYQSFSIPFAAGSIAGAGEQQAEVTSTGGYRVWASLPVKGSFIDVYNLSGTWKAETWVDGVGPKSTTSFELQ